MPKQTKHDGTSSTGTEGGDVWGAATDQPSSAYGESSKASASDSPTTDDKANSSKEHAPTEPAPASTINDLVVTKPSDRRIEQAVRNMTPLEAGTSANAPTEEEGSKKFKSSAHRLAHSLERARALLLNQNLHLTQGPLIQEIDDALAEHNGDKQAKRSTPQGEGQPATA